MADVLLETATLMLRCRADTVRGGTLCKYNASVIDRELPDEKR
jgi:hypothetical protein